MVIKRIYKANPTIANDNIDTTNIALLSTNFNNGHIGLISKFLICNLQNKNFDTNFN